MCMDFHAKCNVRVVYWAPRLMQRQLWAFLWIESTNTIKSRAIASVLVAQIQINFEPLHLYGLVLWSVIQIVLCPRKSPISWIVQLEWVAFTTSISFHCHLDFVLKSCVEFSWEKSYRWILKTALESIWINMKWLFLVVTPFVVSKNCRKILKRFFFRKSLSRIDSSKTNPTLTGLEREKSWITFWIHVARG